MFGTVTLFAFFIILPQIYAVTFCGNLPKYLLSVFAAKLIAIGSVQPVATTNSLFKI